MGTDKDVNKSEIEHRVVLGEEQLCDLGASIRDGGGRDSEESPGRKRQCAIPGREFSADMDGFWGTERC